MKYIEALFATTAGTTLGTYAPGIGSIPVLRSGADTAVITPTQTLRGGAVNTADSVYEFIENYRGNLMDVTFTLTCVTDIQQDILVWLDYKNSDTGGFYAGITTGSETQFVLFQNTSTGFGGVQTVNANGVPGRSYDFRLRVNAYQTILYINGVVVFTTVGYDSIGDNSIRSAALVMGNNSNLGDTAGWQLSDLRIWAGNQRPTSTTIPTALAPTYTQQVMCLTILVLIKRTDGTLLGFTTHDRTLTVAGQVYEAMSAVTSSTMRRQVGSQPDNVDITGILNSDSITESDLRAGLYDDAVVTVSECDWSNVSAGVRIILSGVIGDLTISSGVYSATILSNIQILERNIGETTGPSCHVHMLGDARCKIDLSGNTATGHPITSVGTVTTVTAQDDLEFSGIVTNAGFYTYGLITATSGANAGLSRQCKIHGASSAPDTPTINASPYSATNLSFKKVIDFTPSQTVNIAVPAGVWDTAIMTIVSTWGNRGLVTAPDVLNIQIPTGQANESTVRSDNETSMFVDTFVFSPVELASLNAAAGTNMPISYRHTTNTYSTFGAFMSININSMSVALTGTYNTTSNRIVLQEFFPYIIQVGDTFSLQAGCDRVSTTCVKKFANINNFRGFPFIPGNTLLQTVGRSNDG